jgi:hypothetical protein
MFTSSFGLSLGRKQIGQSWRKLSRFPECRNLLRQPHPAEAGPETFTELHRALPQFLWQWVLQSLPAAWYIDSRYVHIVGR